MAQFVEIVTDVMDNFRSTIESPEDLNFGVLQNYRYALEDMKEADMLYFRRLQRSFGSLS